MRFVQYLNEMTMRAGNLRGGIEPQRKYLEPLIINEGKQIGDLKDREDVFSIYQSEIEDNVQYGLYDGETLVSFFNGEFETFPDIGKAYSLKQMLTLETFSGRHLSAKLMIFLKTRERISIILSSVHSTDTVYNIRKIAKTLPILAISWFNISTGDKDKFDVQTDEDEDDDIHVQGMDGPTDWRILIEGFYKDWTPEGDNGFTHFLNEGKRWDVTKDYSIWEVA